ncbi:MAG: hypothetical protein ACE5HT_12930 [Gemmatimonadales bacterium]
MPTGKDAIHRAALTDLSDALGAVRCTISLMRHGPGGTGQRDRLLVEAAMAQLDRAETAVGRLVLAEGASIRVS